MTRLQIFITFIFIYGSTCSQNFSFNDKVFNVGQTHICWHIGFTVGQGGLDSIYSKPTLDSILKFLSDNPNLKIEIGQHSDNRGKPDLNLVLSQKRAESINDYFIKKGINASRLTNKGYGQTKPFLTKEQELERKRTSHPPQFPRNSRTTLTIIAT